MAEIKSDCSTENMGGSRYSFTCYVGVHFSKNEGKGLIITFQLQY